MTQRTGRQRDSSKPVSNRASRPPSNRLQAVNSSVVSKPLSHEVVQPQLASNYTLPETK